MSLPSHALFAVIILIPTLGWVDEPAWSAEQLKFFEAQIRPLLHTHCFQCHSHNAEKLQASLYLDSRQGMLQGGDSGPAIVPGDPDGSLLIQAVRYELFEMPPKHPLQDAHIQLLARWIRDGAPWPVDDKIFATASAEFDWQQRAAAHWAWQPPRDVTPPDTYDQASAVDKFIAQEQSRRGLAAMPPAPRHALIRRAYFDLIGLPPGVEEVARWMSVAAPDWFEQLVDELLASPHFGEKWARHWLDLARYAESYGHEYDYPIPHAYQYRDYVIRALNADLPYDEFLTEHVAGDLLQPPRTHPELQFNESIIGTGFWLLGEAVHSPTDVRADEADRMANQIDVFAKSFLGMTLACARCHDHKFDPIPTEDYYALAGYLQSSRRQTALLDPRRKIASVTREIRASFADADEEAWQWLLTRLPDDEQFQAILFRLRESHAVGPPSSVGPPEETPLPISLDDMPTSHALYCLSAMVGVDDQERHGWEEAWEQTLDKLRTHKEKYDRFRNNSKQDRSLFNSTDWSTTGSAFSMTTSAKPKWYWFETRPQLTLPAMPHSGLVGRRQAGALRSPTFQLKHRRIHHRLRAEKAEIRLVVDGYFLREFHPLLFADCTVTDVNTDGELRWITQQRDLQHYVGHHVYLEYVDQSDGYLSLGDIRFSDDVEAVDPVHPCSTRLCSQPTPPDFDELAARLTKHWRQTRQRLQQGSTTNTDIELINWMLRQGWIPAPDRRIAERQKAFAKLDRSLPAPMRVLALVHGTGEDENIHIRGDASNRGALIPRRPPVIFGEDDARTTSADSRRLALARHLTRPDNPLVSRVIVNRLWHHLFGRGLVPTVDDFGAMGEAPSHPELLDWLANDLVRHDWSLKHAIHTMMCTEAYQRSSDADASVRQADPNAVWMTRYPRRRLPAESVRDAILCISGRLDRTMYGESVPIHLTEFLDGRGKPASGPLDGNGRRSIYLAVRRNFLSPFLLAFDTPIPFTAMGRRSVSNVPAQSLVLMNDPFVAEQAEHWSRRLISEQPVSVSARIERVFQEALCRPPQPPELMTISDFVNGQQQLYHCDVLDERVWRDVCHAIFNLKEFIFVP